MATETSSLKKQAVQLRLLNELSTRLQGLLESDNFHQEVINLIQSKFNYYSINIWSVGSDASATLRAQAGEHLRHLKIGYKIQNEGIVGQVIATRKSYLANDISTDTHYSDLSLPVHSKAELSVPVLKDGLTVAVLNVESDHTNAFDEDDVITIEAVAAQLAVAFTNRKLFLEATQFNRKLQVAVDEKTLELRRAHERILEQQVLLQKENKALKTLVNQDNKATEIIGSSPAIANVLTMVDKIAPTTATVLIQGESGTGKELIARRLHFRSERGDKPYVTVNCGALQESLLESELFGHEKGSFTGAVAQKMGLCETADSGTIFLDEIGELSLGIQTKLLRFLQEGEFYRIGGKKPISVDVRVVSATNRDLEVEVREGRFREDLFYRLNTITLRMPPLRKRKEDIGMLVEFFLKNSRVGGAHQIRKVDPRAIEVFKNYEWPGNIRELQNMVERLKILADNHEIRLEDLPISMRVPNFKADSIEYAAGLPMDEVEKSHILKTLSFHQGNKTKAAQSLKITIKTLYNKLHRYGVIASENSKETQSQQAPLA